jgi:hypothetical protein
MENLARIVADTLAEHGFETPVYLRPIPWSRWFRCESSFSLLLVPSAPGLYALAEEVAAPGEAITSKRMLAVFEIAEADDLCVTLSRHFAPRSALSARLASGRCFVRFAQLRDAERRRMVCNSLKRWMAASTQTATGLPPEISTKDLGIARDFTKSEATRSSHANATEIMSSSASTSLAGPASTAPMTSSASAIGSASTESQTPSTPTSLSVVSKSECVEISAHEPSQDTRAASGDEPPPLPSGF